METLTVHPKEFDHAVWQTETGFDTKQYNEWKTEAVMALERIYEACEENDDVVASDDYYILGDVINLLRTIRIETNNYQNEDNGVSSRVAHYKFKYNPTGEVFEGCFSLDDESYDGEFDDGRVIYTTRVFAMNGPAEVEFEVMFVDMDTCPSAFEVVNAVDGDGNTYRENNDENIEELEMYIVNR